MELSMMARQGEGERAWRPRSRRGGSVTSLVSITSKGAQKGKLFPGTKPLSGLELHT